MAEQTAFDDDSIDGMDEADAAWEAEQSGIKAKHEHPAIGYVNGNGAHTPATPPATIHWKSFGYDLTGNGTPVMNINNALIALENDPDLQGHIWYDEFLDRIQTDWQGPLRNWKDIDDILLCAYLQRHRGLKRIGVQQCHDAAKTAAFHNKRNSCKDWLESLEWDGTPRLEHMLSDGFGTPHDIYTQAVGRCWIVSVVARVMHPGCKVDTVPVLEGGQGIGKSTALSILGGDWFVEAHEPVSSKDFFGVLDGRMMVEISEMQSFTRAEVERIKGIISCQVDRYRKAYGRNAEDHPRHTVLVCTTNRDDWQRDDTGARRFWPIRCGIIDREYLTTNRDQLFAEAVHRYKQGEPWHDVPVAEQEAQVESRREPDLWEPIIGEFLYGKDRVTLSQIFDDCLKMDTLKQDVLSQRRVARILRVTGWETKTVHNADKSKSRAWVRRSSQAT